MKFVIQRVREASVTVNQTCIGQIQKGFLVLIGIAMLGGLIGGLIGSKLLKKHFQKAGVV